MDLSWRRCEREGATAAASRERPAGGGVERGRVGSVGLLASRCRWLWAAGTGLDYWSEASRTPASRCHVAGLFSCGFLLGNNDEPREKYDVWSTSDWTAGIFGCCLFATNRTGPNMFT